MSAASSPNPNNLILLAVLGIGAYWVFSRQAMAQPYQVRPGQPNQTAQNVNAGANMVNAVGRVITGIAGWFGGGARAANGTGPGLIPNDDTAGQPGHGWQYFTNGTAISPTGTYYHNGQAVWSPDGAAVNPPGNVSAYDWSTDPDYLAQVGL